MPVADHPLSLRILYPALRTLAWGLLGLFGAPMRRIGAKKVPHKGPLLILSNHISNSDPVLVQYATPRLIHFMARRELFDWRILGPFLKWWRAFPVTQSSADTQAIRNAIDLLRRGKAVGIFPEGQLSPTGKLIDILPGAHLIVRNQPITCICLGITGTHRFMPYPEVRPRWAGTVLTARWGEPRTFDSSVSRKEFLSWVEEELRRLTNQPQEEST